MESKEISLPLLKRVQVARNTYSFYFGCQQIDYDFLPGQYNRVTLPIKSTDGRGSSRFFTIASSALEKNYLMITTKMGNSDFKKAMFALEVGQAIQFFGPIGGFIFQDEKSFEHVFMAGGIGITPFYSMIVYAAKKNLQVPITLFVSFSTHEEIVYYDELMTIMKEHPNIKIIYTITKLQESQTAWKGEKGRISEEMIKKYIAHVLNPTFYLVGSQSLVDGMEELLQKMGVEEGKIIVEQFTGY